LSHLIGIEIGIGIEPFCVAVFFDPDPDSDTDPDE
jgi:hypothetical protein